MPPKWTYTNPSSSSQPTLHPLTSVALARLTTSVHHPLRSYHDPFPASSLPAATLTRQNITELISPFTSLIIRRSK